MWISTTRQGRGNKKGQLLLAITVGLSALALVFLFVSQGMFQLKKLQNRSTFKVNTQDLERGLTQVIANRLYEIVVDCGAACLGSANQNGFRNRFNLRRNQVPQLGLVSLPTNVELDALKLRPNVSSFTEMNAALERCKVKSGAVVPGDGELGNFYFCISLSDLEQSAGLKMGTQGGALTQSTTFAEVRAHLVNTEDKNQSYQPANSLIPSFFRTRLNTSGLLIFYRLYSVRPEDPNARILKFGTRLIPASEARGS